MEESSLVTPGEILGKASQVKAGKGAYVSPHNNNMSKEAEPLVYASLTGLTRFLPPTPNSLDQVVSLFLTIQSHLLTSFSFL